MTVLKKITGLFLAAWLLLPAFANAAEYTLRVHHFLGEESLPHSGMIEPWARQVEADSRGRIKVDIYPAMGLGGKTTGLVDQALEGTVDLVWTAAAYTPERFPHAEVFTLPLVHEGDPAATNQAMMSALDAWLAEDFKGLKPLLLHVQAGHSLHLPHQRVNSLADLNGLTIRPAGRRAGLWTVEALGANPSTKRHPKLSKALEQNKLDGALMSFQLAQALDVVEAVSSHTMLAANNYFGTSLYLFLMNEASYENLPAELRAVIDRNSGMSLAKKAGRVWEEAEADAIAAARERGNDIVVLSSEERLLAEGVLEKVLERWSESVKTRGIDGPELIMQARQEISRFQDGSPQ